MVTKDFGSWLRSQISNVPAKESTRGAEFRIKVSDADKIDEPLGGRSAPITLNGLMDYATALHCCEVSIALQEEGVCTAHGHCAAIGPTIHNSLGTIFHARDLHDSSTAEKDRHLLPSSGCGVEGGTGLCSLWDYWPDPLPPYPRAMAIFGGAARHGRAKISDPSSSARN